METSHDEVIIAIKGSAGTDAKNAFATGDQRSTYEAAPVPEVVTALPGMSKRRNAEGLSGFIFLVGLATVGAGIAGFFARSPPAYYDGDFAAYYRRLPWFIALGVAETCAAMWVTGDPTGRRGDAAVMVMLVAVPMLLVTIGFAGI